MTLATSSAAATLLLLSVDQIQPDPFYMDFHRGVVSQRRNYRSILKRSSCTIIAKRVAVSGIALREVVHKATIAPTLMRPRLIASTPEGALSARGI